MFLLRDIGGYLQALERKDTRVFINPPNDLLSGVDWLVYSWLVNNGHEFGKSLSRNLRSIHIVKDRWAYEGSFAFQASTLTRRLERRKKLV